MVFIRNRKPPFTAIRASPTGVRGPARETPPRLSNWLQSLPPPRQPVSPPRNPSATLVKMQSPRCTSPVPQPPSPRTPPIHVPASWRAKPSGRHPRLQNVIPARRWIPRPELAPERQPSPSHHVDTVPAVAGTSKPLTASELRHLRLRQLPPRIRQEDTPEALAEQQRSDRFWRQRQMDESMRRAAQRIAEWESKHRVSDSITQPATTANVDPPSSPEPASDRQSDEVTALDLTPPDFYDDEPQSTHRSDDRGLSRWSALSPELSVIPEQTEQSTVVKPAVTETSESDVTAPSPCEELSDDAEYRAQFQRVVGEDFGACMQVALAGLPVRDEVKDETSFITGYSSPQMEPLRPVSPQAQLQPLQPASPLPKDDTDLSKYSAVNGNEDPVRFEAKCQSWKRVHENRPMSESSSDDSQDEDDDSASLTEYLSRKGYHLPKVTFAARDSPPAAAAPSGNADLFGDILNEIETRTREFAANHPTTPQANIFDDIVLREEVRPSTMAATTVWVEVPRVQQQPGMLSKIVTKVTTIARTAWSKIKSLVGH